MIALIKSCEIFEEDFQFSGCGNGKNYVHDILACDISITRFQVVLLREQT